MKTILLVVFLMTVSVVPTHAQSAYDRGVWMAIEVHKRAMEQRVADQQIEFMKQQIESMKATRREFTSELFQQGFQDGYSSGYKKGSDDAWDYIKRFEKEGHLQLHVLNFMGNELFSETSIERLIEAREGFRKVLNTPNHYTARIYITLIDARLEELRLKK